MITTNVYQRVFQLQVGQSTGTCFTVEVDGKQYLVTARHVIEGWDQASQLQLFHGGEWRRVNFRLVGAYIGETDVAVLAADIQLSPLYPLEPSSGGIAWGQQAYFLGFPYGWRANVEASLNRGFPLPFVKQGLISCIQFEEGVETVFLDGHNNPGFSGGPVVYQPLGSRDFKVAAVISGFRYTEEPVFSNGQPLPLAYRYNTGIVVAYGIKAAVELIKANPIGFPIPVPGETDPGAVT